MSETQKQYEKILSVAYPTADITTWRSANQECPNCGVKFNEMHPEQNLFNHWTGACTPNTAIRAAFQHKQEPDPTTASVDALRAAVVAQTALLRDISLQQRIQYETYIAFLASFENRLMEATSYFTGFAAKEKDSFAALAERLDKLEPCKPTTGTEVMLLAQAEKETLRIKQIVLDLPGRLAAIETKLEQAKLEHWLGPAKQKGRRRGKAKR